MRALQCLQVTIYLFSLWIFLWISNFFLTIIYCSKGDILIHAGDFTKHGLVSEIVAFNEWLTALPHKVKSYFHIYRV